MSKSVPKKTVSVEDEDWFLIFTQTPPEDRKRGTSQTSKIVLNPQSGNKKRGLFGIRNPLPVTVHYNSVTLVPDGLSGTPEEVEKSVKMMEPHYVWYGHRSQIKEWGKLALEKKL